METSRELLYVIPAALMLLLSWVKYKGIEHILIHYRWVFVCLFLLPISVVYDTFFYIRGKLIFWLNAAPKKHDERVRHVQKQVCMLN